MPLPTPVSTLTRLICCTLSIPVRVCLGVLTPDQQSLADALGVSEVGAPLQPNIRDQTHQPKAFPSTFVTPGENEHMRKRRGNTSAVTSGKQLGDKAINQPGGGRTHTQTMTIDQLHTPPWHLNDAHPTLIVCSV